MDQEVSFKKTGNTKVSVIIPTYNRPRDLSTCLDSVLMQTLLPFEVIIVDNGTETASEALIRQREKDFVERGIVLCYVRNSRNSLTSARNLGVRICQGDIIVFLCPFGEPA